MSIEHPGEPRGNSLRAELDRWQGRAQSTFTPSQAVITRAEGATLWTADGRELIDFASGVLVTNLGHAHPGFERRLAEYLRDLPRSSYNFVTPIQVEAARRLVESLGIPQAEKVLWAASGSEAIQKAMWCAQHRHPDRPIMVATRAGYHGKKGLAADVTGTVSPNPDVRWLGFPMDDGLTPEAVQAELDYLYESERGGICLLITEPYLGAAGSYHPPAWYHPLLQAWCRAHDICFIFDEVQSCHGRTGAMYAFEKYGVQPDLVVLGKGLGNGVPVSAVVGRADYIDALGYGEASDTFSGTPQACAAVCAVLDVFKEEHVVASTAPTAARLQMHLGKLASSVSVIRGVRGEGFVFGVEFASAELAQEAVRRAYCGNGTLGVHLLGPLAGKVVRVSPPLTITSDALDTAMQTLHCEWTSLGEVGGGA